MTEKVNSVFLDPSFVQELSSMTAVYCGRQAEADLAKWHTAKLVNEFWSEHMFSFGGKKLDYYIECSRVANDGLYIPVFGESGQTLRRWCEVQETYAPFVAAEQFLTTLSFDHLAKAKKLAKDGRVSVPTLALAEAASRHWSADDMQEHYDPAEAPHPYDVVNGAIATLLDRKNYEWIKSADVRDAILSRVGEIEKMIQDELRKEGKAQ